MIEFTKPRHAATFTDWPLGGNKRGTCTFNAEFKPKKGWRVCRQTTGKPKCDTYARRVAIVDGSNGRTYILQETTYGSFISIRRSDFMSPPPDEIDGPHAVFPDNPSFAVLKALLDQASNISFTVPE